MNEETAWERAASAQGTTESERALAKLAKRAFLSLWSYPNVYTDVGRPGPGDGKELCSVPHKLGYLDIELEPDLPSLI